jgi:hypothetical protein
MSRPQEYMEYFLLYLTFSAGEYSGYGDMNVI